MNERGLSKEYSYTLTAEREPVLRVEQKRLFALETEDAVSGVLRKETDEFTSKNLEPYSLATPELANPVFGPVFVEGVRKGDLLAIDIVRIVPDEIGFTGVKLGQGMFHDSKRWGDIHREPHTKILRHSKGGSGTTADGRVVFSESVEWGMRPFIGTIGVAPEVETVATSITQGPWGGNWDCRYIGPGSTIYFNAYHDGGLIYVGDVHGSQGDGELSGVANEIRSTVELRVRAVKQKTIPYPRIETDSELICFYSCKPLEDAVELATGCLLEWINDEYGVDPRTMYMIFSTCPDFRIDVYQMVKIPGISYTAGVRFPKSYLERMRR